MYGAVVNLGLDPLSPKLQNAELGGGWGFYKTIRQNPILSSKAPIFCFSDTLSSPADLEIAFADVQGLQSQGMRRRHEHRLAWNDTPFSFVGSRSILTCFNWLVPSRMTQKLQQTYYSQMLALSGGGAACDLGLRVYSRVGITPLVLGCGKQNNYYQFLPAFPLWSQI